MNLFIDFTDCKDYFGWMTKEETHKTVIRDIEAAIYKLSNAEQEACHELADFIQFNIAKAGEPVGTLALALVGAEAQAKGAK